MLRAVMDTNVLFAAFYSRTGPSFEVLRRLRAGEWKAVLSNHLVHEYEEILTRSRTVLGLDEQAVQAAIDGVCLFAEEWHLTPAWLPVLHDPDDEPLVQLALESGCNRVITSNTADLAPAGKLGIEILRPAQFARMLRVRP